MNDLMNKNRRIMDWARRTLNPGTNGGVWKQRDGQNKESCSGLHQNSFYNHYSADSAY